MNFKNLVTSILNEEHDPFTYHVRPMTEDELISVGMKSEEFAEWLSSILDWNYGWCITYRNEEERFIVPYLPGKGDKELLGASFYSGNSLTSPFIYKGNIGKISPVGDAIKKFQLEHDLEKKHGLSKEQATKTATTIAKI